VALVANITVVTTDNPKFASVPSMGTINVDVGVTASTARFGRTGTRTTIAPAFIAPSSISITNAIPAWAGLS
jgi:hypothetical protein